MDIEDELKRFEHIRKHYTEKHPDRDFTADLWLSRLYWNDTAKRWQKTALVMAACCLLLVWVLT